MEKFESRAERYRQRAEELLAMAEDFKDPGSRKMLLTIAEEYIAMASSIDDFDRDISQIGAQLGTHPKA